MTTGKWIVAGVPHKGWICVDIDDLGEPSALCEMCEVKQIRYVHRMEHPDYPISLGCGCFCAGHMEQDPAAARKRETRAKSDAHFRSRWLTRKWRTSRAGNDYVRTQGFHIVVYPRGSIWAARVEHEESGYRRTSRRPYLTPEAAKLAALSVMLALKRSWQC
jgi:hypothetical protein